MSRSEGLPDKAQLIQFCKAAWRDGMQRQSVVMHCWIGEVGFKAVKDSNA